MKKLLLKTVATIISFSCLSSLAVYGGTWQEDGQKWRYLNDDGAYAVNCWITDNGVPYYFDGNGYMLINTMTPDGLPIGRDGKIVADTEQMPALFSGSNAEFEIFHNAFMEFHNNIYTPFNQLYDEALSLTLQSTTNGDYASAKGAVSQLSAFDFTPYIASQNIAIRKSAVNSEIFRVKQTYYLSEIIKAAEQQNLESYNLLSDKSMDSIGEYSDDSIKLIDQLQIWNSAL